MPCLNLSLPVNERVNDLKSIQCERTLDVHFSNSHLRNTQIYHKTGNIVLL